MCCIIFTCPTPPLLCLPLTTVILAGICSPLPPLGMTSIRLASSQSIMLIPQFLLTSVYESPSSQTPSFHPSQLTSPLLPTSLRPPFRTWEWFPSFSNTFVRKKAQMNKSVAMFCREKLHETGEKLGLKEESTSSKKWWRRRDWKEEWQEKSGPTRTLDAECLLTAGNLLQLGCKNIIWHKYIAESPQTWTLEINIQVSENNRSVTQGWDVPRTVFIQIINTTFFTRLQLSKFWCFQCFPYRMQASLYSFINSSLIGTTQTPWCPETEWQMWSG